MATGLSAAAAPPADRPAGSHPQSSSPISPALGLTSGDAHGKLGDDGDRPGEEVPEIHRYEPDDDVHSPCILMLLTEAPTKSPNRDGVPVEEAEPGLYRLTVEQFERMAEAGVFPPEDRVELINGVLVEMSPIGDGHVFVVGKLHYELGRRLDGHAAIFDQSSFDCDDTSLPQPDLVIAPWPYERYARQRPSADVALVVIEAADSSLRYDKQVKVPLYARSGVPEVWVVDLPHRRIHVCTDPKDDGYATTTVLTQEDALAPIALPDVEIPVSDLGLNLLR